MLCGLARPGGSASSSSSNTVTTGIWGCLRKEGLEPAPLVPAGIQPLLPESSGRGTAPLLHACHCRFITPTGGRM